MEKVTDAAERYRITRNVTLVGAVLDIVLGIGKIVVGILGNSQALVADGIHSLSDLGTDFIVIFAAKHASREADENHPYGHGRIETAMTVALGIALIIVALGIAFQSLHHLFNKDYSIPTVETLYVAIVSIVTKEMIYHYTMYHAKKINSPLMIANAWHSRSDAISSIVVLIGIAGVMAGLPYLDAIAAIFVSAIVFKIGWKLSRKSVQELVDTSLDKQVVDNIRECIFSVSGVKDLHYLRTRSMGADALVDVHIQVAEDLSVSEGHQISEIVRAKIIDEVAEISDVMVHIDPEDDEEGIPENMKYPVREELLADLQEKWRKIVPNDIIIKTTIHYLSDGIRLELVLKIDSEALYSVCKQWSQKLEQISTNHPNIIEAKVYFNIS